MKIINMSTGKTIEEAAKDYANSNFENCKYTYTDDNRLTNFDELYKAYKEGAEQFKAQEQKPIEIYASKTTSGSTHVRIKDNSSEYKIEVFEDIVTVHTYKNGEKQPSLYINIDTFKSVLQFTNK